jgi:DNA repair exonuclease SbcCD ATPase subunit
MKITSNAQAIEEAEAMQAKARETMERIQQQTQQTQEVAAMTLGELQEQRRQSELIELQAHSLESKLQHTNQLQNSFDRWSLNLRGKKRATKEAKVVLAGAKAKQAVKSLNNSYVDPAVAAIKNKVTTQRRPKRNKEVVIESTSKHFEDVNPLDEADTEGLDRIDRNDKELDAMLDQIDASLDGITNLSLAMKEEAHSQHKNLKSVNQTIERANQKQAVAITRVRRNLTGKWLRSSHQSEK